MTYTKEITIWCEGRGCDVWKQVTLDNHLLLRNLSGVRKYILSLGWSHVKGKDYCPKCSKVVEKITNMN